MRISDILKLFKKKTICYYCHIEIKDNQRKEFAHFTIGLFGKVIPSDWMHVWCYCKYFDTNYKDFIDKKKITKVEFLGKSIKGIYGRCL